MEWMDYNPNEDTPGIIVFIHDFKDMNSNNEYIYFVFIERKLYGYR